MDKYLRLVGEVSLLDSEFHFSFCPLFSLFSWFWRTDKREIGEKVRGRRMKEWRIYLADAGCFFFCFFFVVDYGSNFEKHSLLT